MKYFGTIKTLDELKKAYRRLAMENHPDRGGDTETMKAINAEYKEAFNRLKNGGTAAAEAETVETSADFIRVVDLLMRINGIEIELCGSWLWISGDTFAAKEELKAAGCKWASKKKAWYWHPPEAAKKSRRKEMDMESIRTKYGSRTIHGETRQHAIA